MCDDNVATNDDCTRLVQFVQCSTERTTVSILNHATSHVTSA